MYKPLVSVIIPTYNRDYLISSAIDSVLRQTYKNIEIIVIDDGSADRTCEVLERYGNQIRLLQQKNLGPSAARNHGINVANGEIITFLDSDDIWLPEKIERQVNVFGIVDDSIPCCLCNAIVRDYSGNEYTSFGIAPVNPRFDEGIWTNVTDVLSTRCIFFTQAIAVRRKAIEKVGGFDETLWIMEDHDLALRLSLEGPWAYIKEPLLVYRQDTQGSLSANSSANRNGFYEAIITLHENVLSNSKISKGRLYRKLKRNLKIAERKSKIHKACEQKVPGAKWFSKMYYCERKVISALSRRTPLFPKIQDMLLTKGDL